MAIVLDSCPKQLVECFWFLFLFFYFGDGYNFNRPLETISSIFWTVDWNYAFFFASHSNLLCMQMLGLNV